MDQLCSGIRNNKYQNILVIAGAGISVASGIPDFRSSSVFSDYAKKYGVDSIEELLSIQLFYEKPHILYDIMKDMITKDYEPNVSHQFLKLLQDKKILVKL
jgi:NAD-dependent SIR2 family protein deacetylase